MPATPCFYADEFGFDTTFERRVAAKMQALLDRAEPFTRFLIAEIGGERADSIAISALPDNGAFLNFVLVEPVHRRKGLADALMMAGLDHARQTGCRFVRLETYSLLDSARKLYGKLGFEIVESTSEIAEFGQDFDREFWEMRL